MDISERRIVHCPPSEASRRLAAFVADRRIEDGSLNIALRLPLEMLTALELPVERRGVAMFYSLQSARDTCPTYSVSWSSRDGGPFSDFAGALAVERVLIPHCFGLVLSGYYLPRDSRSVAILDADLEWRIAHRLTHELLDSIANEIEAASAPGAREGRRLPEQALTIAS